MLISSTTLTQTELQSAIVHNPLIVAPNTTVRDAIALMSSVHSMCSTSSINNNQLEELHIEARSSCVLIVKNQQLLGIFTERDIVRICSQKRHLDSLPISEVMTHPIVTLYESDFTDLFVAINLLKQLKIRHLPLLNEQDRIVGLLTHETLRQTLRPVDLLGLRMVKEVMIADVVTVSSHTSILAIAELMAKHRISSVVIVEAQEGLLIPIGFVTERDIVQFHALDLNVETCQAHVVMNKWTVSVRKDDSLLSAQQIMQQQLTRHLVVTGERGELQGIITQTSILQSLNSLELYKLAITLQEKVAQLEVEKIELLESRAQKLERQVEERTATLKAKAEQERLIKNIATQIRSSLNLDEILKITVEELQSCLKCDHAVIWQLQSDHSFVICAQAITEQIFTRVEDPCFLE